MAAAPAQSEELAAAVKLDVGTDIVRISNVARNGSVVLFSCARTSPNGRLRLDTWAKLLRDDDSDGVVEFTPAASVPLRSVWIAVDVESGGHAIGAHPDFPLYAAKLPVSKFRKDDLGAITALEMEISRLTLLLVRPGKGAWILTSYEGGAGDADAPNGKLTMLFEQSAAISGKEAPPKQLKGGDFVAAIDPSHLDVWFAEIGK